MDVFTFKCAMKASHGPIRDVVVGSGGRMVRLTAHAIRSCAEETAAEEESEKTGFQVCDEYGCLC